MIVPTVGRRLYYRTNGGDNQPYACGDQPFDAGILFVHNDRQINVDVTDHVGQHWPRQHVLLIQEGDSTPSVGVPFCEWMPYQKSVAR